MIQKLYTYISETGYPYHNLATESWLMDTVPQDTVTLFLWQNDHTVVVGRNQNCWAECRVNELEADGGYLVRRLSGGGAVFHDMQNLNFTFLANDADYNVDLQLKVIIRAMEKLGLEAEKTGRNDITIEGKKFSGNAFYQSRGKRYHHGTILVDVDTDAMSKYLMPSKAKLESKGVSSVKSRVVNIKQLVPDLTIERLKTVMIEAFEEVYGQAAETLDQESLDLSKIAEREAVFSSWDWKFGRNVPFSFETEVIRYPWGSAQVQLNVEKSTIKDAEIFSDAMDALFIESLVPRLINQTFDQKSIRAALDPELASNDEQVGILSDMADLILGQTETK